MLPRNTRQRWCIAFDPRRAFNIEGACLPERNLVFVVDDDAMMLRSVARLLRQSGYVSLLFPSAEAFANQSDFDGVVCVILDIDLGDGSGIELRHRLKEANISVRHLHHRERKPSRSHRCASIRVPRLSRKAILGEVAAGPAT